MHNLAYVKLYIIWVEKTIFSAVLMMPLKWQRPCIHSWPPAERMGWMSLSGWLMCLKESRITNRKISTSYYPITGKNTRPHWKFKWPFDRTDTFVPPQTPHASAQFITFDKNTICQQDGFIKKSKNNHFLWIFG